MSPFRAYRAPKDMQLVELQHANPSGAMPMTWGGKPAIWLAWTGDNPMPDLLALCLTSIQRHNGADFAVNVVTPKNLPQFLDPHPAYEHLSLVHRADYLRLSLLHRYGGIYLDMDTISLRSLAGVYEDLAEYDLITYDGGIWGEVFGISVFGPTRRDSNLTRAWSEALESTLDRLHDDLASHRQENPDPRSDCLGWNQILSALVTPLARQLADDGRLSIRLLEPDWAYFAEGCPGTADLFRECTPDLPDTELLILNHAMLPDTVRGLSSSEILDSRLGICRLLQLALGCDNLIDIALRQSPASAPNADPTPTTPVEKNGESHRNASSQALGEGRRHNRFAGQNVLMLSARHRGVNIVYIILAHKLPGQLIRLIDRLDAPSATFLIHVDRDCDASMWLDVRARLFPRPNVHLLNMTSTPQGSWSFVSATLNAFDHIARRGLSPDHVVLLSGQDYPLRTPEEIETFFAEHREVSFLHHRPFPDFSWDAGGWTTDGGMPRLRGVRPPTDIDLWWGSTWWALDSACVAYVEGLAHGNRELIRFFEAVDLPEEMFFQTAIVNSPFRDRLMYSATRRNAPGRDRDKDIDLDDVLGLHYVDWHRGSPKTLGVDDFDRLIASPALFARKFDMTQDAAILDMIDAHLGSSAPKAENGEPPIDAAADELRQAWPRSLQVVDSPVAADCFTPFVRELRAEREALQELVERQEEAIRTLLFLVGEADGKKTSKKDKRKEKRSNAVRNGHAANLSNVFK